MFGSKLTEKQLRNKQFNEYERLRQRNEYRMKNTIAENARKAKECEEKAKLSIRQNKRSDYKEQYNMMMMYLRENKDIERNIETNRMEALKLQRGIRYSDMAEMTRTSANAFSKVAGTIHMKKMDRTNEKRANAMDSLDDKINELSSVQDDFREGMLSNDQIGPSDGNDFPTLEEFEEFVNDTLSKEFENGFSETESTKPAWLIAIENTPAPAVSKSESSPTWLKALEECPDTPMSIANTSSHRKNSNSNDSDE